MAQVTISRDERRFAPVKTLPQEQVVKTPTSTEVTSVQAVVEKVKEDFHKLYYSNEKLRRTVGQKKQKLQVLQKKTEECCTQLGSVGTQVSVDENKLNLLTSEVDSFREDVENVINDQLKQYNEDVEDVVHMTEVMMAELTELDRFRIQLEETLTDTENMKWRIEYKLTALIEKRDKFVGFAVEVASEVEKASSQLEELNLKREELTQKLICEEQAVVLSKDRLADMERTIATNDGVAESLKQDAESLKKELEDAESARAKTREDATAQLAIAEKELQDLTTKKTDIDHQIAAVETNIQSDLQKLEALRKEGDDLRRVSTDIHERRLRAQEDLEQVQKTKEDCAAQLLLANEALVTAKKATEEAEKDLSTRMEASKTAIQVYYKLKSDIQQLEWQTKQAELAWAEKMTRKEREAEETRAEEAAARDEIALLAPKLEVAKKRLEECLESGKELQQRKESLLNENNALQDNTRELEAKKEKLSCAIKELDQSMRGGDPNELEEAIQKATQLKDAQEEQLKAKHEEAEKLRSEIEVLKKKIGEGPAGSARAGGAGKRGRRKAAAPPMTEAAEAEIEKAMAEKLIVWEKEGEKERAAAEVAELEAQIEKLQGGVALNFPDLVLTRSHEISRMEAQITEAKERSKQNGFSSLVSQLHGKIDSEKKKKTATASPEIADEENALPRVSTRSASSHTRVVESKVVQTRPTGRGSAAGRAKTKERNDVAVMDNGEEDIVTMQEELVKVGAGDNHAGGDIKGGRGGEGSPVRDAGREEEESQADNNPGIDLSPVDATKRPATKKTQIPKNKRVAKESHVSFAEKSETEEELKTGSAVARDANKPSSTNMKKGRSDSIGYSKESKPKPYKHSPTVAVVAAASANPFKKNSSSSDKMSHVAHTSSSLAAAGREGKISSKRSTSPKSSAGGATSKQQPQAQKQSLASKKIKAATKPIPTDAPPGKGDWFFDDSDMSLFG